MDSQKTVMIIEDEPDAAEMFAEMMRVNGYRVLKMFSSAPAIRVAGGALLGRIGVEAVFAGRQRFAQGARRPFAGGRGRARSCDLRGAFQDVDGDFRFFAGGP